MKKTLLLLVAVMATAVATAQNHGDMNFIGSSTFSASTASQDNLRDTVIVGDGNTSVTLPVMVYKALGMTLPSIKFTNLKYVMTGSYQTGDMAFVWEKQYADTIITVDGVEKHLKNVNLVVRYIHTSGELSVVADFQYGVMPFPLHYEMTGYYTADNAWKLAGRGKSTNPYKIYSIEDLQAMSENISAENTGAGEFFLLMNDIDFNNNTFNVIGKDVPFAGTFDGNNKAITNLTTNNAKASYADIFGEITEDATIKNLTINGDVANAIENVVATQNTEAKTVKLVKNGKIVILKNNSEYNVAGALIR